MKHSLMQQNTFCDYCGECRSVECRHADSRGSQFSAMSEVSRAQNKINETLIGEHNG
jgi:hypothetical protein